jgi:hypothetical protein
VSPPAEKADSARVPARSLPRGTRRWTNPSLRRRRRLFTRWTPGRPVLSSFVRRGRGACGIAHWHLARAVAPCGRVRRAAAVGGSGLPGWQSGSGASSCGQRAMLPAPDRMVLWRGAVHASEQAGRGSRQAGPRRHVDRRTSGQSGSLGVVWPHFLHGACMMDD